MQSVQGLRIVVTRALHQSEEIVSRLELLGAEVISLPMVAIAEPADPVPLRQAAQRWTEYDWIVFTSANAVSAFAAALDLAQAHVAQPRVAAIGGVTRQAAERAGFAVTLMPDKAVSEGLADAFLGEDLRGSRILIPSAAVTRNVLAAELTTVGATVQEVEAYRNVIPPGSREKALTVFRPPYPDWVTFASASAFEHLVELVGIEALRETKIATIGPITSEAVRNGGLVVHAEARVASTDGIVDALYRAATEETGNDT